MENKSSFKPVGKKERIHVLDALRGFAIFGILIINIGVFSGYSYLSAEARNELLLAEWNTVFDWFHTVFFSGKFYTLFSLLFGIGFAIQLIRASESNRSIKSHFSRRLFILLIIGIIHLWGIWFSDILVLYAVCGYLLILFKDFSYKVLLIAAFFIMLIPGVHSWYLQTADYSYTNIIYEQLSESWNEAELPTSSGEQITFEMADVSEVIRTDSWSTVLSFNYIGPLLRGYIILLDARLFKVLAVFILGLWAGHHLLKNKLHENNKQLISIAAAGLIIGLPLNIYYEMDNPGNMWMLVIKETLTTFGYIGLTAFYAASFMLLFKTGLKNLLTKLFSPVGKTALTNYILQSVICIFLFYEAGLGLGKYFGSAYLTLSVFLIFIFQVLISILWLKHYRFGPLEWLWRVLTYSQYLKNRNEDP